jgi:hypothetical protein
MIAAGALSAVVGNAWADALAPVMMKSKSKARTAVNNDNQRLEKEWGWVCIIGFLWLSVL